MKSPVSTSVDKNPLGFFINFDPDTIDIYGQGFMHEMAREGDLLAAEVLFNKNIDINACDNKGWTPLHEAAFHGQLEMVIFLIENGAKVNAHTDNNKYTALHLATLQNHKKIATFLLKAETDPNKFKTKSGKTPLHLAAEYGLIELVGTLIQHRADLFAETSSGQTACDLAQENNQVDTAAVLNKLMQHYQYRFS